MTEVTTSPSALTALPNPMRVRRLRAWLSLWCVVMVSAMLVSGWGFWAVSHQTSHAWQLPPGAGMTTEEGSDFRIVSLHQTREVAGEYDTYTAAPGATWVIVTFEVTLRDPEEICLLILQGRDGKTWEYTTDVIGRERGHWCTTDFPQQTPTLGEAIYEVPESEVPHLVGVVHKFTRDWRGNYYAMQPPK